MAKNKEGKVECHLTEQVELIGGLQRKLVWGGRKGAPDRFVTFGWTGPILIEVKAPDGKLEWSQVKEIPRLREHGVDVRIIDSIEAVDAFIAEMLEMRGLQA